MRRRKGQERDASVYQEETRDGHTALLGPHTSFHYQHLILILNTFTLQSGVYAHAWRNPWRHGEPRRHTSTRWRSHVHPVTLTRPPPWRSHVHPVTLTFVLCRAHALVAVDEVPAGGSVQARAGETLVVLLFAVEAMVAWGIVGKVWGQTTTI